MELHQNRLEAIFSAANDGIFTIDVKGTIESVNPAGAILFGYSGAELLGKNIKMLMPDPHHSAHDGYLENYKRTGERKIIGIGREAEGKKKDGTVFPIWLSISEAKIDDQTIYTGVIHDLTAIRKAESNLSESEKKLSAIIKNAVDGIITIDSKGTITSANPAVSTLFGYQNKELLGNNISMLTPEPHRSNHDQYISNYLKTGSAKIIGIGREVEGRRKDGSLFPMLLSISEVKLNTGILFAGIIHDISAQKEAENRIKKLNEDLESRVEERTEKLAEVVNKLLSTNEQLKVQIAEREAAEKALIESRAKVEKSLEKERQLSELKSRFVSMASHEFRTPLSTILSSASLIGKYQTEETAAKRQKHIDRIKSSVDNLTGILNDFLSLSKLEEGKIQTVSSKFNLRDLVEETVEELQSITKPGQEIKYTHVGKITEVYLDKSFLKNILTNLLSNSLKYSDEGKPVFLETHTDSKIRVVVADQGIGIPEEDQVHMFERFFRAKNSMNIQGTGLGLNIVKKYLNVMGGEINFTSKLNEGSRFEVTLPLAKPDTK